MNDQHPTTSRARFDFKVLTYADSNRTPWIATEPIEGDLDELEGFLGFDLVPGTTYEQAREIAEYMNDHIKFITYTTSLDDAQIP